MVNRSEGEGPERKSATVNVQRFATGNIVVHVAGDLGGDAASLLRVHTKAAHHNPSSPDAT